MHAHRICMVQGALILVCAYFVAARTIHRSADAADIPKFNYAMCSPAGTATCVSCLPCMIKMPGEGCDGANSDICGVYRAPAQGGTYTMCQQAESAGEFCTDTGTPVYKCTGGGFFECGCATWDGLNLAWVCADMCNSNCGGTPDYSNVWAYMGSGCVNSSS